MTSLYFENQSSNAVTVCLYQTLDKPPQGAYSVVWQAARTPVGAFYRFPWQTNFDFVWREQHRQPGGGSSETGQTLPAAPGSSVTLSYADGSFVFGPVTTNAGATTLTIAQDALVHAGATAGIGMYGAATVVVPTQPNLPLVFPTAARLWLTVGDYKRGEKVSPPVTPVCELVYPPGRDALYVALGPDNLLTVPVPIDLAADAMVRFAAWQQDSIAIDENSQFHL